MGSCPLHSLLLHSDKKWSAFSAFSFSWICLDSQLWDCGHPGRTPASMARLLLSCRSMRNLWYLETVCKDWHWKDLDSRRNAMAAMAHLGVATQKPSWFQVGYVVYVAKLWWPVMLCWLILINSSCMSNHQSTVPCRRLASQHHRNPTLRWFWRCPVARSILSSLVWRMYRFRCGGPGHGIAQMLFA